MNKAYLLIGGNMGNREHYLSIARNEIKKTCGEITRQSAIYQTAAWGLQDQDAFLNQVILIETNLKPYPLLQAILSIEEGIGRKRELKYGPRIIDIDILLFNNEMIESKDLVIPHAQMQNRRFVLEPLNEIAADVIHPVLKKTINRLLIECTDNLTVQKFQ